MVQNWNYDKPHRCPQCHGIWTYALYYQMIDERPKWWRTYMCVYCGAVFSGRWAWAERWRDKARGKANYWRRKWRRRRSK